MLWEGQWPWEWRHFCSVCYNWHPKKGYVASTWACVLVSESWHLSKKEGRGVHLWLRGGSTSGWTRLRFLTVRDSSPIPRDGERLSLAGPNASFSWTFILCTFWRAPFRFVVKWALMGVMPVRFFLCARNLNLQEVERSSEIGPRQLINSRQRCINQQRVFLNFSLRSPLPKGWLKENRKEMSSENCFLSVQKTEESGEQCPVLVSRLSFLGLMFRV